MIQEEIAAAKLRTAFDLHIAGCRMMRQTLKRRHPEASEEEIHQRFRTWLHTRPGAEFGDGPGEPIEWPRKKQPAT